MGTARCKCRNNNGQKLSYLKIPRMRVTRTAQPRAARRNAGRMERVDPRDVLGVGSAGAPARLCCSFCFHQNMFCFYRELPAPPASLCTAAAQTTGRGDESQTLCCQSPPTLGFHRSHPTRTLWEQLEGLPGRCQRQQLSEEPGEPGQVRWEQGMR